MRSSMRFLGSRAAFIRSSCSSQSAASMACQMPPVQLADKTAQVVVEDTGAQGGRTLRDGVQARQHRRVRRRPAARLALAGQRLVVGICRQGPQLAHGVLEGEDGVALEGLALVGELLQPQRLLRVAFTAANQPLPKHDPNRGDKRPLRRPRARPPGR
jgi:hypothetical protein